MADDTKYEIGIDNDIKELGFFGIFAKYIFPFLFTFFVAVIGIVFVTYLLGKFVPLIIQYPAFPPPLLPKAPNIPWP